MEPAQHERQRADHDGRERHLGRPRLAGDHRPTGHDHRGPRLRRRLRSRGPAPQDLAQLRRAARPRAGQRVDRSGQLPRLPRADQALRSERRRGLQRPRLYGRPAGDGPERRWGRRPRRSRCLRRRGGQRRRRLRRRSLGLGRRQRRRQRVRRSLLRSWHRAGRHRRPRDEQRARRRRHLPTVPAHERAHRLHLRVLERGGGERGDLRRGPRRTGHQHVARLHHRVAHAARRLRVRAAQQRARVRRHGQRVLVPPERPRHYHHVVGVGAITANNRNATTTWLQKANFSNFGAHVQLVGPTDMPGASMALSGALPNHSAYSTTQSGTSSSTPHAVDMVSAMTIPPEADMTAPDWYALVDGMVPVPFYANARWASTFGYTLEFAAGVEPTSFTPLASASGLAANPALSSADLASNFSATWNTTSLANGIYTLRLRVTDNLGNLGEDRRAVWVRHPDPQDLPGFPRQFDGSPGLSVALVDLDDDNTLEVIFGDGNGDVHALRSDGTDLTGFPVHTDPPAHLPLTTSPAFLQNLVPVSYPPITGGVPAAAPAGAAQRGTAAGAEAGKGTGWLRVARPG